MNFIFSKHQHKFFTVAFLVICAVGILLRVYYFLMGRSLWEDEAHLALNFISRDFIGILKPLDNIQAAPPLFLLSIKMATFLFGFGEKALRLIPFLFSIGTLPLIYYITRELLQNKLVALFTYTLFSVNLALITFSSELKTYGVDVAMYLILVWLFVSKSALILKWRNLLLAFSGVIMLLYSNVTFIIMACIAIAMLTNWIRQKKINTREGIVLIVWFGAFIIYYLLFLHKHPYQAIQTQLYESKMPPYNIFSAAFWDFMGNSKIDITSRLIYFPDNVFIQFIALESFIVAFAVALKKKSYNLIIFCIAPIALHFLLSLLHLYPFWYRFILYTIPGLLVFLCYGIYETAIFIGKHSKWISVVFASFFLTAFCYPSLQRFPNWWREIMPVINYTNKNYSRHKILVTTPYTLYKYYQTMGAAKNGNFEPIEWSVNPEQFTALTAGISDDFLLLSALDTNVDGYGAVKRYLEQNKRIQTLISNKSYQLSLITGNNKNSVVLNTTNHFGKSKFNLNGKEVIALWDNNALFSDKITLNKGKYLISITSSGTAANNIYPFVEVLMNGEKKHGFYTTNEYSQQHFYFDQKSDELSVGFQMTNDSTVENKNEDRNAFILTTVIKLQP